MATTVSAPSWWSQWGSLVTMYSAEFNVPLNLAAAVLQQESSGNPNAQSTFTYPDGTIGHANGLMQVVGGSFDPATNIAQGMKILSSDLNQWGTTFGLAAYNAGGGNVAKYGANILNPAYLLAQGWRPQDAYQPQAYVTAVTGFANQWSTVLGPTLPVLPPVSPPVPSIPPLPGTPVVPLPPISPGLGVIPVPTPASPTAATPALAPIPAPTPTGFWPVDAFNSASNTVANGILSIERFFFIAVGLFLIGLGLWLLVKAGDNRGSSTPS